ncbi:Pimeloyl-ACP methyl ester carboxylesterase [Actinokineospora alba]|uniref:Pimeloyl-ACP methyl ester carboxylesterase n=1 Tax=Actinokineospora alba TaxID=504798 RepID=A0A1H0NEF2_9PSEU|nr:alpha/beta hydrolase [Actinokineospora alba]TDP68680.1 pimeloyl-ACP methyl ester carboxylesterase [Actinokineospora alba]SDH84427.1 Pimeloyl-ACP methyl ester carboxylesterase [Actinokineospora alba]SDO90670.1 Pimeloyl-ACP methyl ester carboxylesterase [Actinokineospora alba]
MTEERIHRAVSEDGTEIVGRVRGQGPPLVLVHGGIGDGEVAWEALLPELTDRFTCYLPSTRGRGLSADNPDHSPPRLVADVTAFVDSIGEPVHLVGWSGSGAWVLGAAARSDSVAAVAVYEPALIPVMGEDDLAQTFGTMERVGAAAAAGRLVDAMRAFTPWICTDEEITALERTDFVERWAGGIPAMLRFIQHDAEYQGPRSTDPEQLALITAPVVLLRGRRTRLDTFFTASVQFIAQHVADSQVWELPGLGHFAPVLAPRSVAEELITFFESARQPA